MTTRGAPEPSNEELWAQPPAAPYPVPPATPYPVPPAAHQVHLPAPQAASPGVPAPAEPPRQKNGVLALAITSLGVGIPLTAVAVAEAGMGGLVVAWIGIVGVNAVYAFGRRRP